MGFCAVGTSLFSLFSAGMIFIADRRMKNKAEENGVNSEPKELFNGRIILKTTHNYGLPMNRLDNHKGIVVAFTSIVFLLVMILYAVTLGSRGRHAMKIGMGLLAGGAAGNIYDRWKRGYVVDYFSFSFLRRIVFNIADISIIIGSLITMTGEILESV